MKQFIVEVTFKQLLEGALRKRCFESIQKKLD